jgi:hypothetical protein
MEQGRPLSEREVEQMARQYEAGKSENIRAVAVDRFPLLSFVSMLMRVLGWAVVVVGVGGFSAPAASCGVAMMILAPMIGSFVFGLAMVAMGELLGVFRAIEGNTHRLLTKFDLVDIRSKLTQEENG